MNRGIGVKITLTYYQTLNKQSILNYLNEFLI